ncbi:MAG: hypothetical protein AAGB46_19930, partial [Verrucomicrobiota bacterium]
SFWRSCFRWYVLFAIIRAIVTEAAIIAAVIEGSIRTNEIKNLTLDNTFTRTVVLSMKTASSRGQCVFFDFEKTSSLLRKSEVPIPSFPGQDRVSPILLQISTRLKNLDHQNR